MTKRVQIGGGNGETEAHLVGLERELRVDESNDSLRLHDGVKEGGFEFLNRDASDARFQKRSLELDGFKFGPQEKGILVRVSPSTYRVRKIVVNVEQLVIENPRGTAGDFKFSLADTISTSHSWTGIHLYEQAIDAQGGVVGDLTGNVTGDVTGDVTGNLTGNASGDHMGSFTGDLNTDGFEVIMGSEQIEYDWLSAETKQMFVDRGIPLGGIIMWSGLVEEIPDSWALCDGDNGTPDLRGRFIAGAGGDLEVGNVGGTESTEVSGTIALSGEHEHTVAVGDHALTLAELPSHWHANGVGDGNSTAFNLGSVAAVPPSVENVNTNSGGGTLNGKTSSVGEGATHTHEGSVADGGAHTHDITLDNVSLVPPYYALAYIMKIA
jgi:hypothetical protein